MINSFSIEFISHCSVFLSKCFFFGFPPPPPSPGAPFSLVGTSPSYTLPVYLLFQTCTVLYLYHCTYSTSAVSAQQNPLSPSPCPLPLQNHRSSIHPFHPNTNTRLDSAHSYLPSPAACHVMYQLYAPHCTAPHHQARQLNCTGLIRTQQTNLPRSSLLALSIYALLYVYYSYSCSCSYSRQYANDDDDELMSIKKKRKRKRKKKMTERKKKEIPLTSPPLPPPPSPSPP